MFPYLGVAFECQRKLHAVCLVGERSRHAIELFLGFGREVGVLPVIVSVLEQLFYTVSKLLIAIVRVCTAAEDAADEAVRTGHDVVDDVFEAQGERDSSDVFKVIRRLSVAANCVCNDDQYDCRSRQSHVPLDECQDH
eukprot:4642644-Prymnesium_polylepis.2